MSKPHAKQVSTRTHEDRAGWDIAEPPCDSCLNRQFCKVGKFACKDFDVYTQTNKDLKCSKTPSIIIYRRLFSG
jgi:hypothetical protein